MIQAVDDATDGCAPVDLAAAERQTVAPARLKDDRAPARTCTDSEARIAANSRANFGSKGHRQPYFGQGGRPGAPQAGFWAAAAAAGGGGGGARTTGGGGGGGRGGRTSGGRGGGGRGWRGR